MSPTAVPTGAGPTAPSKTGTTPGAAAARAVPLEGRVQPASRTKRPFTDEDIERFKQICAQQTDATDYPLSSAVEKNTVIYDGDALRAAVRGGDGTRDAAMAELHKCILQGPGVFVIKNAFDTEVVDRASSVFGEILAREAADPSRTQGDHFAPAGTNGRIWNSFQKHAEADPASFVAYYSNELVALAAEAWLGPGYQVTAQNNTVNPGGKAQEPHRDYHLGFQSEETAARFPVVAQIASQLLTLQGAVAHTDMPLPSGPTQLLPFSQLFDYGYQAYRHAAFADVFHSHMVQLPLSKGDALFFNPALFHAAGNNTTSDFYRSANLLQISACWGKAMEAVDRTHVAKITYPHMRDFAARAEHRSQVDALTAAVCDAYSFPTNLDRDPPPPGGHCPPTQLDRVRDAIADGVGEQELAQKLDAYDEIRRA